MAQRSCIATQFEDNVSNQDTTFKKLNLNEEFLLEKKRFKAKRKLTRKKKWCPGCSYPYYTQECPRCGGE